MKPKFTKDEISFLNKLFTSKAQRETYKKESLEIERYILTNKDFTVKPETKQEYQDRKESVKALNYSVDVQHLLKEINEMRKHKVENCKFKLYKNGKKLVIANKYRNPGENKIYKTYHYMPNGFPFKHRKRERKYRDTFEFKGYKLIDSGNFKQVFDHIVGSTVTYYGKKSSFTIRYRQYEIGTTDEYNKYWISVLKFKRLPEVKA